jgi:outer membrane protein OmpU
MKKLLLATSILAGTAGLAAAEITLSGDARMGIINDFVLGAGDDNTTFTSRARVTFTMTGSTDTGLEFGASFRADNANGAASGTAGSVYVSGAFGKLSMGDVDGAAQMAVGHVDGVGLTGLGDLNESAFLGAGGLRFSTLLFGGIPDPTTPDPTDSVAVTGDPTALYEYSTGPLSFYASVTKPSYRVTTGIGVYDGLGYAAGVAYSLDNYKFSLGYENVQFDRLPPGAPDAYEADHVIIGADATFGAVTVKARYGKANIDLTAPAPGAALYDLDQWALSATYKQDALSVTGFASNKHFTNAIGGTNIIEIGAIGIGAGYDLGGGASVKGGIVQQEVTTGAAPSVKDTAFDLGLSFSF